MITERQQQVLDAFTRLKSQRAVESGMDLTKPMQKV